MFLFVKIYSLGIEVTTTLLNMWYNNTFLVFFFVFLKVSGNFDIRPGHLLYRTWMMCMDLAKCKSLFWLLNGDQVKGHFPP